MSGITSKVDMAIAALSATSQCLPCCRSPSLSHQQPVLRLARIVPGTEVARVLALLLFQPGETIRVRNRDQHKPAVNEQEPDSESPFVFLHQKDSSVNGRVLWSELYKRDKRAEPRIFQPGVPVHSLKVSGCTVQQVCVVPRSIAPDVEALRQGQHPGNLPCGSCIRGEDGDICDPVPNPAASERYERTRSCLL